MKILSTVGLKPAQTAMIVEAAGPGVEIVDRQTRTREELIEAVNQIRAYAVVFLVPS